MMALTHDITISNPDHTTEEDGGRIFYLPLFTAMASPEPADIVGHPHMDMDSSQRLTQRTICTEVLFARADSCGREFTATVAGRELGSCPRLTEQGAGMTMLFRSM